MSRENRRESFVSRERLRADKAYRLRGTQPLPLPLPHRFRVQWVAFTLEQVTAEESEPDEEDTS